MEAPELIGDRIGRLIKEAGYAKPKDFYKKIKEIYGNRAFARYTLTRILENKVQMREVSLQQIATALFLNKSVITSGTNAEKTIEVSKDKSFTFAGGSTIQVLEKNLPFVVELLSLRNDSYYFLANEFSEAEDVSDGDSVKPPSSVFLEAIRKTGLPMPNKDKVRGDLNKINSFLKKKNLYTHFPKIKLPPEAINLTQQKKISKSELLKLNRIVLETAFPNECPKLPKNRLCSDEEQDDQRATESLKWIFIMKGKVNVIIKGANGETKHMLTEGQGFSFDARQKHYFENLFIKTSKILIIHYPAANNIIGRAQDFLKT